MNLTEIRQIIISYIQVNTELFIKNQFTFLSQIASSLGPQDSSFLKILLWFLRPICHLIKLSLPLGKANPLLLFQIPCLLGYSRHFLEIVSSFLGYLIKSSPSLFFFLNLQTYCYFSSVKKRAYSLNHTACSGYQAINSKMLQTTCPQLCCLQFLSSHFSLKTILIRILTPSFQENCCCQGYW